jgi:hypothetical protein
MTNPRALSISALVLLAALLAVEDARGDLILPDRSSLNSLLGGNAVTEGFESFNVPDGTITPTGTAVLDSTTIIAGQGPGLIVPGLTIRAEGPGNSLFWMGRNYFGQPSRDLLASIGPFPSGQSILLDFTAPVTAFGLDLLPFSGGFNDSAIATVFARDDVTVLATVTGINLPSTDPATPVFFGYEAEGGIGSVRLTSTARAWSPIIDNLTFGVAGVAVPEPSALFLLTIGGLGLMGVSWRRRQHLRTATSGNRS